MPIGSNNGTPSDQFSFRRSFIANIAFPHRLGSPLVGGPDFVFQETLFPANIYHITVAHNFWTWTSNMFTLDHIISDAWATITPSPTVIPLNVRVTFVPTSPSLGNHLLIDVVIVEGVYNSASIPLQAQPYWYPP